MFQSLSIELFVAIWEAINARLLKFQPVADHQVDIALAQSVVDADDAWDEAVVTDAVALAVDVQVLVAVAQALVADALLQQLLVVDAVSQPLVAALLAQQRYLDKFGFQIS